MIKSTAAEFEKHFPLPQKMTLDSKQSDMCFHGFSVNEVSEYSDLSLPVEEVICTHRDTRVFASKCLTDRRCAIAVKEYNLANESLRRQFYTEISGYRLLMNRPHRNFVGFYGACRSDEKGFLILELGDKNFHEYLKIKKPTMSVFQFNEICFQLLSMIEHLETIGLLPDDYKFGNMIFSSRDGAIKLIDLESYELKSESPDQFTRNLDSVLQLIGQDLLFLQLEMKCRENGDDITQAKEYFYKNYSECVDDPFDVKKSEELAYDELLWHKCVSETMRKTIASCFVKQPKEKNFNFINIFSNISRINDREAL